jgi:DeoR/GlpR family transcriptional regulator of sugar metabolism
MIPVERQRTIMRLLTERGSLTIAELVEALDVSHMTVRRDIAALESAGRVSSVARGVTLPSRLSLDLAHADKAALRPDEKAAIGSIAATLVGPGDVIFLDAGTTTLEIARAIATRDGLVVVTNDLVIAQWLAERSTNELHLAAGLIDRANLSAEGRATADAIREFNFDVAFISTPAFDLRGSSVHTEAKNVVKNAAADNARRVFLVTDSTKYGRVMPLKSIALERFDGVVTDAELPESAHDALVAAGLDVLQTSPTSR